MYKLLVILFIINFTDQKKIRLNKISKTQNYFNQEISQKNHVVKN